MKLIDLDVEMDAVIQNIVCLGKITSICKKQDLRNT